MARQPTLPPGSYYDVELEGYVLPHEPEWSATKFASSAEEPLPVCPCGTAASLLIFTSIQPLDDEARAMAKGGELSNITGLCLGCAKKTGMVMREMQSGREDAPEALGDG